jgi:hypothetical protein
MPEFHEFFFGLFASFRRQDVLHIAMALPGLFASWLNAAAARRTTWLPTKKKPSMREPYLL